jgi:signal transduction histidine kinase
MAYVPVPRQRRALEEARDFNTLCHDLRQCVTAGLLLSNLPKDNLLDVETRRRFELIQQTLAHAGDILESAKDEEPKSLVVDLTQLVEECAAVAEFSHKIRVELDVTEPVLVAGDPLLLHRAVDNMIDNAGRAAGESGDIVIRLGASDDETWVEVADDGPGFGRIEHGTGQGLAVISSAVQACNGRLEISSGPGPGTSVRVTLPRQRSITTC